MYNHVFSNALFLLGHLIRAMHLSKKEKKLKVKKRWKLERYAPMFFFILVMWNYNVIIFLHSSFWSKRILVWCLEDDILSILNIRPNPRLCVFWWEWLYNLKTGSRTTLENVFFLWVTNLKEPSIDVGVVVDGAVLVVAHDLDHLLMQLCSCSVMQACLPRCRGNVWKSLRAERHVWCLTNDHTSNTKSSLFYRIILVLHRLASFLLWLVWRVSLQSNWENLSFSEPNMCPSAPKEKHISNKSTDRTRRRLC